MDRGVPYAAVGMSALFSALAYLSVSSSSSVVFNWLLNFTNTAGFISWVCCMIVYIRFRKAASAQGVELPYKSKMQPWGAYVGMCGATFLLLVNGFTVFFPSQWSVSNFFTSYIGIPAFLVIYAGHRLFYWRDPWAWEPMDVDMQTGLDEIMTAEKPPRAYDTWYKKLMILIE